MRSISIIHPSRGRPEMAINTAIRWICQQSIDKPINEYFILVDDNDPLALEYVKLNAEASHPARIIINKSKTAIEAINIGAKTATSDILIVISDDFDCPGEWDVDLLEAIGDRTDFCAKTQDSQQDWLITLPIVDRKYYERLGYIYHPSYSHMWADTDMTCTAHLLGKYISLPIEFHHNHPRYTDQIYDATYQRARATWGAGQKTFRERMQRNFDIVSDIKLPKGELIKQGIR